MMSRRNIFRRDRTSVAGRRRFQPTVLGLEERTLLSGVLATLSQPRGVTVDSQGDFYVSYNASTPEFGQEEAVAEFNSQGQEINSSVMTWYGSNAFPGSLVTLGSSESLPGLTSGDITGGIS